MKKICQALMESDIFRDISEEVIRKELIPYVHVRDVSRGDSLICFQAACSEFGVILKGRIAVEYVNPGGKWETMNILGPGDYVGMELGFTERRISPFLAIATQNSRVVTLPVQLVLKPGLLTEPTRQQRVQNILLFMANENVKKEYRISILFQRSLREKIMAYLTTQSKQQHANPVTIPFNRTELASYLCINRTCLSRELRLMEQEGIVSVEHNTFTLLRGISSNPVHTCLDK